jgi:hypothetical protein
MIVEAIGSNQTRIETSDHKVILVSYKTPVAAFIKGKAYAVDHESTHKGKRIRSRTTSKHINAFLEGHTPELKPIGFFTNLI